MLTKATSSMDRLEMSIDNKSIDLGFGSGTSDETSVKARSSASNTAFGQRGTNPWPAPSSGDRTCGGGFGSSTSSGFGGGFGGSSGSGFGFRSGCNGFGVGGFGKSTTFEATHRRMPNWQASLTPVRILPSDLEEDPVVTMPSETQDMQCSHRGFFSSSRNCLPRSSTSRSSSRRLRHGRRKSGRRGSDRPGHCFNCGEHGHISKLCPKKMIAASADEILSPELRSASSGVAGENNFGENFLGRMVSTENSIKNEQISKPGMFTREERSSYHDEKLENQKARLSYYGCTINDDNVPGKCASPEVDKFSEQLDNALNLSPRSPGADQVRVSTTPTRMPEKVMMTGRGGAFPSAARTPTPLKVSEEPTVTLEESKENKIISSTSMTIETRRTVLRNGEPYFEECTVVSFPSVLPPNVRVITAQFVPAATEKL